MNILELSEQEIQRRQSLEALREMGIEPYPAAAYPVNAWSDDIKEQFSDQEDAPKREVCIAGRLMGRKAAFNALSMEEFEKEMEGIDTTCVVPDTLDESPMAYKSMDEIVAQIGPTAEIIERIRPVYNFKAAD